MVKNQPVLGRVILQSIIFSFPYSHPWAQISPHIRLNEIFDGVEGLVKESPSTNHRLQEYLDQYIKVLEEDRTRFIDKVGGEIFVKLISQKIKKINIEKKIELFKILIFIFFVKSILHLKWDFFFREISCLFTISDAGGGQYVVNAKHIFTELAAATAESIVLERYGSKALRIFRVVREKLRIEETQLQSLVMIPAKEVKYLTYTLMEGKHILLRAQSFTSLKADFRQDIN